MNVTSRVQHANALIENGLNAEQSGDLNLAYQYFTEAHDAMLDCPRLHKKAHQHLKRVNWKIGHYGELLSDVFVLSLAPIGFFEALAFFMKSKVLGEVICKR
ncbi:MAG: hypothetical protein MI867_13105 [Pseudomonadales bacterium]|nr:hypothetical protein [Pseudomonadales bacterium]